MARCNDITYEDREAYGIRKPTKRHLLLFERIAEFLKAELNIDLFDYAYRESILPDYFSNETLEWDEDDDYISISFLSKTGIIMDFDPEGYDIKDGFKGISFRVTFQVYEDCDKYEDLEEREEWDLD